MPKKFLIVDTDDFSIEAGRTHPDAQGQARRIVEQRYQDRIEELYAAGGVETVS